MESALLALFLPLCALDSLGAPLLDRLTYTQYVYVHISVCLYRGVQSRRLAA